MSQLRVTGLPEACGRRVEDVVQLKEKTEKNQLVRKALNITRGCYNHIKDEKCFFFASLKERKTKRNKKSKTSACKAHQCVTYISLWKIVCC